MPAQFDPSQPFEVIGANAQVPKFDPSQAFETLDQPASQPSRDDPDHWVDDGYPAWMHKLNAATDKVGKVISPITNPIGALFDKWWNGAVHVEGPQTQQPTTPSKPIPDVGQDTFRGQQLPTAGTVPYRGNELDIPSYIAFKAFGPDREQVNQERQAAMQSIVADTPQIGLPAKQSIPGQVYDALREGASPFLGPTPAQVARDSVQLADGSFAYKPGGSTLDRMGLIPALGPENPNIAKTNIPHFGPQTKPIPYLGSWSIPVEQFFAGVDNNIIDLVNFAKSPLGLLTAGIGALPASGVTAPAVNALKRAQSLGFTADMGSGIPGQVEQLEDSKGVQQNVQNGLGLLGTLLFTGATAKHGLTGHLAPETDTTMAHVKDGVVDELQQKIQPSAPGSLELPPSPVTVKPQPTMDERIAAMSDDELGDKAAKLAAMVNDAAVSATHNGANPAEQKFAEWGQGALDKINAEIARRGEAKKNETAPVDTAPTVTPADMGIRQLTPEEIARSKGEPLNIFDNDSNETAPQLPASQHTNTPDLENNGGVEGQEVKTPVAEELVPEVPEAGVSEDTTRQSNSEEKGSGQNATEGSVFDEHPLVQVIQDAGGLMSRASARRTWGDEKYQQNASLWDDAPTQLADPRHSKIYNGNGGLPPDQMVEHLKEAGLLPPDAEVPDLWREIGKISQSSKAVDRSRIAQRREADRQEQQGRSFEAAALQPKEGTRAVNASELSVGDEVEVGGEKLHVTDIDPDTYAVTLQDGSKFGAQTVTDGKVLYVESAKRAEPGFKSDDGRPATEDGTPVISLQNRIVDQNRSARGLPPLMGPMRQAWGTVWDAAMRQLEKDPKAGENLVESLQRKMRPLSDEEGALLHRHLVALSNRFYEAVRDVEDAKTDEERAKAQARADEASRAYSDAEEMAQKAGTSGARGLNYRKALADEDYTLLNMLAQKKGALGRELNESEKAQVKAASEKIRQADEAVAEHERAASDAQLRKVFAHFVTEAKRSMPKNAQAAIGQRVVSFLDAQADAARKRMKERGMRFNSGIDPTQLADHVIIGADHLAHGIVDFGQWSTRMLREFGASIKEHLQDIYNKAKMLHSETAKQLGKGEMTPEEAADRLASRLKEGGSLEDINRGDLRELAKAHIRAGVQTVDDLVSKLKTDLEPHFKDITDTDIRHTLSNYGKVELMSQDAVNVKLRDLTAQSRLLSQFEDAENGRAPKRTGLQRDQPSDVARGLTTKVKEAMRKNGIETRDPEQQLKTSLDTIKTSLRHQIADLTRELETGEKRAKSTGVKYDEEAERLRGVRDRIQKTLQDIEGKPEMPLEQRLRLATKAAEEGVAEYERRLKEKDFSSMSHPKVPLNDPKLNALQQRLENLKKRYDQAKKALWSEQSKESKQLAASIKATEASIEEYKRRIAAKDFSSRAKQPLADSPELRDLRQQRDALKEQYQALKDAQNPKMTPEQRALAAYKRRLQRMTSDYQDKLARKDFTTKTRKEVQLDEEGERLKAVAQKARDEWQQQRELDRYAKLPLWQRSLKQFNRIQRAFKLSAMTVLGKLTGAAATRMATTPAEETVGGIASHLPGLSRIAAKAPREGGMSISAEAKAITSGITDGMKDAWDTLKTGHSEISTLYGDKKLNQIPQGMWEFFGHLHGALKAPVKRAEFARSVQKRVEWNLKNGIDPNDPVVKARIMLDAYKDANRAIFMQDNFVSDTWRQWVSNLERNKKHPVMGPATAGVMDFMLPIIKVPTNIIHETITGAVGLPVGATRAVYALIRGTDKLEPEVADSIMRQIKKGSIGAAALAVGYFNPDNFGGYYQRGDKRDENDVQANHIRLFGVDLPTWIAHAPVYNLMQMGATIRRVADSVTSSGERRGIGEGAMAATLGLIEESPYVRQTSMVNKVFEGSTQMGQYVGELARNTVSPQFVQQLAKGLDQDQGGLSGFIPFSGSQTIKRQPKTIMEHIEAGLPGLRKNVPEKNNSSRYAW